MDGWPADQVAQVKLEDLQTPCLILDRGILEKNLRRMSDSVRKNGAALRPHLKTAKSAAVARMAVDGERGGITVSTVAEAEYFAGHGFPDILIAAALPPNKLERAANLVDRGAVIGLVTDDVAAAASIANHRGDFRVLIELDSGDRRAGVDATSDDVLAIGRALGAKLAGVMTHAGHSYSCRSIECIKEVAEHERLTVVTAANRLRDAGMRCDVVSVGSTPTMTHAERLDGVTEGRPGVYMFQDVFQAEIGSCTREDIALTVLASVIGRKPGCNGFLIDAGALALSKDRSTGATPNDVGYGEVWNASARPVYRKKCIIERVYQEHGVVSSADPLPFDEIFVGAKVRVAPNHSCLTAAAHDRYYVVDGSDEVIDVWDRVNGW
ncbi:MAG TPA: alanine racemase [Gemmatimonadaceae bacterium]|nr:alanine racemase [Gemmatimonadaceae bacterium]